MVNIPEADFLHPIEVCHFRAVTRDKSEMSQSLRFLIDIRG